MFFDGVARSALPAPQWRRRVAYLPAEPGWWGDTVGVHFADWSRAEPLVVQLGLPPEARDWVMTRPSTGERARLGLARALAVAPGVLLLDEPTAALDAASVARVEAMIAAQRERGLAVCWVSHDPAQAARIAGRHLVWRDGRFVEEAQ